MNVVEKEAQRFISSFYKGAKINNLENLKSKLTSMLFNFNREKDKLDFLKTLRQQTLLNKEDHFKECDKDDCQYITDRNTGLFVIDQEIDDINKYYTFTAESNDQFTSEEEASIHDKLNSIIDRLKKQEFGQEIIFEEIESLKNHFNLGKKTWFQLLKGKLFELSVEKALDETIVKEIYSHLSEGVVDFSKMIGKVASHNNV